MGSQGVPNKQCLPITVLVQIYQKFFEAAGAKWGGGKKKEEEGEKKKIPGCA